MARVREISAAAVVDRRRLAEGPPQGPGNGRRCTAEGEQVRRRRHVDDLCDVLTAPPDESAHGGAGHATIRGLTTVTWYPNGTVPFLVRTKSDPVNGMLAGNDGSSPT